MSYGFIYETTNLVNGKKYVGRCKGTPEIARTYLGSGMAIMSAVKKYGRDNFSRRILELTTKENHAEREQYWIDFFDCAKDPNWYNLSPSSTGGISNGRTGKRGPDKKPRKTKHPPREPVVRKKREPKKPGPPKKTRKEHHDSMKKRATLVSPDGTTYEVFGVLQFAKEHCLHRKCIGELLSGKMSSYKGWTRSL